jgi:hypothetical protein
MRFGLGLWLGLLLAAPAAAPAQGIGPIALQAEAMAATSTGERLPFWLTANQRGTVDPASANLGLRLRAHRPVAGSGRLQYAWGAEVLGRVSENGTGTVQQLYGRLRYGRAQLTAGRRARAVGRIDPSLSMGSVTWTANAPPPPRISVSSDGYVAVPGLGDAVALRGYLGHGWLESDRFTRNALLHEKSLYLRLRAPGVPVTAHAGIVHHAIWGGTNPLRGAQEVSLRQWARVALGSNIVARPTQTEEEADREDANHVAMYDFSLDVDLEGVTGRVYRQFYIEDAPGLWFRNVWDGLWGVRLQRDTPEALVHTVLWEHLRMTRQGARFDQGEDRGADSYYNHFKYKGGWTYQGRTLGTPLLTPAAVTPGLADTLPGIGNNIVVAHHLGIEGHLGAGLQYRALGTYSRNYGAKNVCMTPDCASTGRSFDDRRDQWSMRLGVRGPLSHRYNLRFHAAAALDTGEFYDERVGLQVGLQWRGEAGAP